MSRAIDQLATPSVLVDLDRLEANIARMQAVCDRHGVELWPHIKTHKMVEVARRQLAAGARGLTCAKLGEAEAMLPSGVRSLFIAHSLVDPAQAPRLRVLADRLDRLILACTSIAQAEALARVLAAAGLRLPVMMAFDTGLGREGARGSAAGEQLANAIRRLPQLELAGIYTHEGHTYALPPAELPARIAAIQEQLLTLRDRLDSRLKLWPGCSVTAAAMAARPGINAVRPGAYVFGDLHLAQGSRIMAWDDVAATVLATMVDRPEPGLALIDAGSKTFSSDKTAAGISASADEGNTLTVSRCNEEHGYLRGEAADRVAIGQKLRLVPAHICPVINLTDRVTVVRGDRVVGEWTVEARGKVQ